MLNKIWFWLLLIGILAGAGKGAYYAAKGKLPPNLAEAQAGADAPAPPADNLTAAEIIRASGAHLTSEALDSAEVAVKLCITLIGIMALWLGLMNIAKDAGLVDALARAMRPALRWLFPDVPDGHPAQGSMLMNLSANALGMGNAATPLGLIAMNDLQTLNKVPDTCTNAMSMFLAINTSSVTLVPITMIGLRIGAGSTNPAAPMAGLLMATTISTATAIVATKMLSRLPRYALPDVPSHTDSSGDPTRSQTGTDDASTEDGEE
jgi:spore maturation protein A